MSKSLLAGITALIVSLPCLSQTDRARFTHPGLADDEPHSGPIMSLEQLRVCVKKQDRVKQLADALDRERVAVTAGADEVARLDAEAQRRSAALDDTDERAVASFNVLVEQQNEQALAYNRLLPEFNERVRTNNIAVDRFNEDCAPRPYRKRDFRKLSAGRK